MRSRALDSGPSNPRIAGFNLNLASAVAAIAAAGPTWPRAVSPPQAWPGTAATRQPAVPAPLEAALRYARQAAAGPRASGCEQRRPPGGRLSAARRAATGTTPSQYNTTPAGPGPWQVPCRPVQYREGRRRRQLLRQLRLLGGGEASRHLGERRTGRSATRRHPEEPGTSNSTRRRQGSRSTTPLVPEMSRRGRPTPPMGTSGHVSLVRKPRRSCRIRGGRQRRRVDHDQPDGRQFARWIHSNTRL